ARIISQKMSILPAETILGQLWRRLITEPDKRGFQPVNANFGLLPALPDSVRDKKLKKELLSQRSLDALKTFLTFEH
ncbi:MAG: methylenetetrahydrofolate--tRNA-(uracil(54)-C(5))-methyltransferase (FADH(2)-oxidizing) TrmFO, partial [Candidatus Cloacimonetes bacterium]|nr:methylenetetrahydrofolate--tRNA-(uracil(54)-C(5))-methyltransferase (FADH(2)-oxidizing) TrmFO [Candidatus Cloacimonadota bacterium]